MKKILFGPQTKASVANFPFDYPLIHKEFIYAMAMIKKAAASANEKAGKVTKEQSLRMQEACDEILSGEYDDQFVVPALHGGAGTSVHMNVNEVIASLSNTHANDHVNASMSTNDVNPSALRVAAITLTRVLLKNCNQLIAALDEKAKKHKKDQKLGRTHMQDAVPTTFGAEFASYRDIIKRDRKRVEEALYYMYELNIGGTAIGDATNAPKTYRDAVYKELRKVTGIKELKPLENLMSGTSSDTDFHFLSSAVTELYTDISKIATDFRFMSSGPRGSIGEIAFKKLQPGSSIMPGKVNPIVCETMNQLYYQIAGRNLTIQLAAEGAHMELGVMLPAIVDSLIVMLKIAATGVKLFSEKGIGMMVVNSKRGKELLERSTAYSTMLTPRLGYDTVSQIVHEAIETNRTLREVVLKRELLTDEEFDKETTINN
ncbi:MAG: lyase family protein [Microgenomates group bacterium]